VGLENPLPIIDSTRDSGMGLEKSKIDVWLNKLYKLGSSPTRVRGSVIFSGSISGKAKRKV
jgi:hypothetical protein